MLKKTSPRSSMIAAERGAAAMNSAAKGKKTSPRSSMIAAERGAAAMNSAAKGKKTKPMAVRTKRPSPPKGPQPMAVRTKPVAHSLSTDRLAKPMQSMDAKKNLKAKPTKQAKRPIVSDKAARMIGKSLKGVGISGTALTLGKAAIDAVRSLPGGKKKGTSPAFSKKGRTKK